MVALISLVQSLREPWAVFPDKALISSVPRTSCESSVRHRVEFLAPFIVVIEVIRSGRSTAQCYSANVRCENSSSGCYLRARVSHGCEFLIGPQIRPRTCLLRPRDCRGTASV